MPGFLSQDAETISLEVETCPRCGERHTRVKFTKLERPIVFSEIHREKSTFSHWSACPKTGDPILIRMAVE